MFAKKEESVGMSVSDFYGRWATGRLGKFAVPASLRKVPLDEDSPTIYDLEERQLEMCDAPFGDFLSAYVDHLFIPRRLRRHDWGQVEELFRSQMNRGLGIVRFPRLA